jgi:penicillin-binding protein 1A
MMALMRRILKILAWVGAFGLTAAVFGMLAVMGVFAYYNEGLPSFEKLAQYEPPVVTRLYAANGKLLAEYATEKRIFTPFEAIPDRVRDAFIAAEDKNFYTHKGIDIYGIARAVRENIQNFGSGRSMVGGSTITQQVVKNFLLTNEKSFERKIKEAILAYRISKVYSKDKILELYLNEIYLGNGSYGVAAAALNYFNKTLGELNIEEAALLAALPKAPTNLDPRRYPDRAFDRRNYVLGRMFDDGYITEFEAQRSAILPITLQERAKNEIVKADFFAEEVRRDLADLYGSDALYEGGLTVKTTVDETLQSLADKVLRQTLIDYDRRYGYRGPLKKLGTAANWEVSLPEATADMEVPLYDGQQLGIVISVAANAATIGLPDASKGSIPLPQLKWAREDLKGSRRGSLVRKASDVLSAGDIIIVKPLEQEGQFGLHQIPEISGALVAMEPNSGKVLAMAGGYSAMKSEFNRATQAKRQPGSAFKPFVYLSAFENGFTPSTIVVDQPIEISQGPGKPLWKPKNYDGSFAGPTTLRVGLEKSRNMMTVRLAQMLGIGRIINVAKRFGIYEGKLAENYSMVLGAKETSLINMVTAYSMLANGGREVRAALIERIDDRRGKIIYRRDTRPCVGCQVLPSQLGQVSAPPVIDDSRANVVDPRIAYQLTSILQGVAMRGTAAKAYAALKRPIAGKTGTTNDSRDAWFIGYAPDLVVGVYVGFDKPRSLGDKETGGKVALPGFINFMKTALKDVPKRPFPTPAGIRIMQVDRNTGLPPHPGGPAPARMISEVFVSGGPIYRPPLPDDAADEKRIAMDYDTYDSVQDGFDPYADWQDVNHYMSPERAQRKDAVRRNALGTVYPGDARYMPNSQQPRLLDPPTQGYNINANPPASPEPADPYQRRTPAAQQPASGARRVNSGTGGLY